MDNTTKEPVYLASFTGIRPGWQGVVNRIIRSTDKTIYSHNEIVIGNPFEGVAECYSSSGVDHGVRRKDMQLSRDKWEVVETPWVTADQVRSFFTMTDAGKYDYMGVSRFLLPWMLREHPTDYFCSEWCAEALQFGEAWRFSPALLHIATLSRGGCPLF